jgi:ubiquinone biosynthesis monooxygenase Coq7
MRRSLSLLDEVIKHVDVGLKTVTGSLPANPRFSYPADSSDEALSRADKIRSSQLMRINHCGEVCAQGLYHGQSSTARSKETRKHLAAAAEDERKHLIWCQTRLQELDSHTSFLNPIWYAASWMTGAVTGLFGDKISLGFIAATEEEVCQHLDRHLEELPSADDRSRAIIDAMKADEAHHQQDAISQGGTEFPAAIKRAMALQAKVMTETTRWV